MFLIAIFYFTFVLPKGGKDVATLSHTFFQQFAIKKQ